MENIGYHVLRKKSNGKDTSFVNEIKYSRTVLRNTSVIQTFVAGPKSYCTLLTDEDCKELKEYIKETNLTVIAHATYFDYPFKKCDNSMGFIKHEMSTCTKAGIQYFLIHLDDVAPELYVKAFEAFNLEENPSITILLETKASAAAKSLYTKAESLISLYQLLSTRFNIGICVDTAHLHSSGVDLSTPDKTTTYFNTLLSVIPKDKIFIHLNDDQNRFGGGKDHHATLMEGNVWNKTGKILEDPKKYVLDNKETCGILTLLQIIKDNNFKCILERPDYPEVVGDYKFIDSVQGLLT